MPLDSEQLKKSVEDCIKATSSGNETYRHRIKVKCGTASDMSATEEFLIKDYSNRFRIKTEVEISEKTNYYVLMIPISEGLL